jgi:hypothetical protein
VEQEKQTAIQAFLQAGNVQRPRPVIQKLIKIMGAAIAVPKRGHNKFHNYKYVLESDLVEAVRKQVVEHGLFIFPSVSGVEYMPDAKKEGFVTSVVIEYHVIDGETGDSISFKMAGSGHDKLDKGVFKAITGANKYALMKLFQIGTGDDPEQEEAQAPLRKPHRDHRRRRCTRRCPRTSISQESSPPNSGRS